MVRNRVTQNLTILKIQKIAFCNGEKSGNPKSHHSKFNPTKASVLDQSNSIPPIRCQVWDWSTNQIQSQKHPIIPNHNKTYFFVQSNSFTELHGVLAKFRAFLENSQMCIQSRHWFDRRLRRNWHDRWWRWRWECNTTNQEKV